MTEAGLFTFEVLYVSLTISRNWITSNSYLVHLDTLCMLIDGNVNRSWQTLEGDVYCCFSEGFCVFPVGKTIVLFCN